ncbi:hypothetical protein vseg_012950 [Gypsophila vaccaria]
MAAISENQIIQQLTEVGNRLLHPPSLIPELLNLLDEVEFLFAKMRQAPSQPVQEAFAVLKEALITDELFRHSDPNVKITVASCLNEVTRISAPTPPYEDDKMREVFELIVSSFENLSCQPGRCYSKAVLILLSVAKLRSCVMLLDLDCDSLVTKMFELFQKNISPKHPQNVFLAMVKIMSVMIQESDPVSLELLKLLLTSIKMENQSVSPASWEMGVKILEGCTDKIKPFIMETVSSMGCCLEDYAPILVSICKPEANVTNPVNDSANPVNTEPSDKPAESIQGLKAKKSSQTASASSSGSKAIKAEGTISKKGRKPNPHVLDKEAAEHKQVRQGTAEADISKKNESPRKDVALKSVKEETVDSEQNQRQNSSALGDSGNKKGRPPKKEVPGVSGDRSMKKKNDVPGSSVSSGKKIVRQPKENSGGSGNKNKLGQSGKDKLQLSDSSRNQRKRASSDDDVIETPHGRKNYKDDLVGSKIKVWWPLDRRYYEGTITSYDASIRKHRVDYDDGDEEILNLRKEQWEFLGDETPTDIASLLNKKTPQPSAVMAQPKAPTVEKKETSQPSSVMAQPKAPAVEKKETTQPSSVMAQPKAPTVEKKEASQKREEKVITPTVEIESGDAIEHTTLTVAKSEIPETPHETKKPRLSDEQNS